MGIVGRRASGAAKTAKITSADTDAEETANAVRQVVAIDPEGEGDDAGENLLGVDYAAIDAVLARSVAAIAQAKKLGRLRPIR